MMPVGSESRPTTMMNEKNWANLLRFTWLVGHTIASQTASLIYQQASLSWKINFAAVIVCNEPLNNIQFILNTFLQIQLPSYNV